MTRAAGSQLHSATITLIESLGTIIRQAHIQKITIFCYHYTLIGNSLKCYIQFIYISRKVLNSYEF